MGIKYLVLLFSGFCTALDAQILLPPQTESLRKKENAAVFHLGNNMELSPAFKGRVASKGLEYFFLLELKSVRVELGLSASQFQMIDSLKKEFVMRAVEKGVGTSAQLSKELLSPEQYKKLKSKLYQDLNKFREKLNQESRVKIEEILLDFQSRRFDELVFQACVLRKGVFGYLQSREGEIELSLTKDQSKEIRSKQKKLRIDNRSELEVELKRQQKKILEVLSSSQRKKYRTIVGEENDWLNGQKE